MKNSNSIYTMAGLGWILIIILGITAEFLIRQPLMHYQKPLLILESIATHQSIFQISILADVLMLVLDVFLAWAIYQIFKTCNASLAMLAAIFRLVHAAIYGGNLLNLLAVLNIARNKDVYQVLPEILGQQAQLHLQLHALGYSLGLIFFAFSCLIVGYLIYISLNIPNTFAILFTLAGWGYLIDSLASLGWIDYGLYQDVFAMIVFIPALIGELSFSLWLIFKGGNATIRANATARLKEEKRIQLSE